jgi:hypothetical protein
MWDLLRPLAWLVGGATEARCELRRDPVSAPPARAAACAGAAAAPLIQLSYVATWPSEAYQLTAQLLRVCFKAGVRAGGDGAWVVVAAHEGSAALRNTFWVCARAEGGAHPAAARQAALNAVTAQLVETPLWLGGRAVPVDCVHTWPPAGDSDSSGGWATA